MNNNAVRWELHNYYANIEIVKQIREDLKIYREMDNIKARVIMGAPVVASDATDKILDRLEYIAKLEARLDKLIRTKHAIDSVFGYLKEPDRSIIEMRYFITPMINDVRQRKYSWDEIAREVKLAEQYVKQIDAGVIYQIQLKIIQNIH